jgi:hypothetical protein
MKKLLLSLALSASFGLISAQQKNESDQDRLQQQPLTPTEQVSPVSPITPRPNRIEPQKQSDSELRAEKLAKEKSQTQKQTKVQPNGLPPNLTDTLTPPSRPQQLPKN